MNDPGQAVRQHVVQWDDPIESLRRGMRLDGIGYLQAVAAGEIPPPPIAALMGFELAEVAPGRCLFVVTPHELHYNPMGVVHGGLAATLIDSATGCAIQSLLPAGRVMTTVDLNVTFVRPLRGGMGEVRCEGKVIHHGRTVATAEARVTDADGKLLAYGHATCRILEADLREPPT